jgi:hypothetical protein
MDQILQKEIRNIITTLLTADNLSPEEHGQLLECENAAHSIFLELKSIFHHFERIIDRMDQIQDIRGFLVSHLTKVQTNFHVLDHPNIQPSVEDLRKLLNVFLSLTFELYDRIMDRSVLAQEPYDKLEQLTQTWTFSEVPLYNSQESSLNEFRIPGGTR